MSDQDRGTQNGTGSCQRVMQIFGGMEVCQDTFIPEVFTIGQFCRIANGPDEVHMFQLGTLTARELTT